MANQFPNILPPGFSGNVFDFNKAKIDRSGALRIYTGTVAVASGTVVGQKIGLVPVRKGAKVLVNGSSVWFDALGASVTTSIGITYQSGSSQTEAPATFVAAGNTTAAAGGNVLLNGVEAGLTYVALDDGWISITLAGATTGGSSPNVNFNIAVAYDFGALQ